MGATERASAGAEGDDVEATGRAEQDDGSWLDQPMAGRPGDPPSEAREAGWLEWKQTTVEGRFAVYGEAGSGSPALFLHGWGLDHKAYKRALSRLVRAGLHVYAPALPGFGGTVGLPDVSDGLRQYADWVSAFLDSVGVGSPVLAMGHSFGGGVAVKLAHDHPHHVRALVLINSVGGSAWAHTGSTVRSMAERPLWDWGIHFPADLFPVRQARRVLPVIVAEGVPNLLRDPRSFFRAAGIARRADLTEELDELRRRRLPVVVLWGQRDQIITRESFEDMCRALGNPDVVTVPGTHSWLIADPDAFGEIITNVLEVVGRGEAGGEVGSGDPVSGAV
ncbi:MAG TPA: alpha/beta hydrolase [Acidimicrobiales bacterium]|nr:alpha/beta hydrolase [Acidimicrobiales bacterium]